MAVVGRPNLGIYGSSSSSRRLLQSSTASSGDDDASTEEVDPEFWHPCYSDCRAQVRTTRNVLTIEPQSDYEIDLAVDSNNVVIARLTIPSGSLLAANLSQTTTLEIRPVADSQMRDAENQVAPSRVHMDDWDFPKYMTFAQTVLSPAFQCIVSDNAISPFPLNITYTASIDTDRHPFYDDVCLAWLYTVPEIEFTSWKCVLGNREDRNEHPVGPLVDQPEHLVQSAIIQCGPADANIIYAFIHSPLKVTVKKFSVVDFIAQNIYIIMGVFLGLGLIAALVFYSLKRLHRYRKKYHDERDAVKKMADEVNEMEQFGGKAGTKDDELQMVENPMVRQMKDMQRKLDAKELEMQQAEQAARMAESALRQDHITRLKDDKDGLQKELDRLKQMLADAQQAHKAEVEVMPAASSVASSDSSAVAGAGAPDAGTVRLEFAARLPKHKREGSGQQAAGRKKKELD